MTSLVEAADQLVLSLGQREADLKFVTHRLEAEFADRFKQQAVNPFLLVERLHALERELDSIRSSYAQLAAAKTELLQEASQTLARTTELIQQLESKAGISVRDDACN